MHARLLSPASLLLVIALGGGFAWGRSTAPQSTAPAPMPAPVSAPLPSTLPLPGAYAARVIRVVDGDTLDARVEIWPGQSLDTKIRLRDIDAPELTGACIDEKRRAEAARDYLARLEGEAVIVSDIRPDKFFGRVVARVTDNDGGDVGAALLAAGHARPYGGRKRASWCTAAASG